MYGSFFKHPSTNQCLLPLLQSLIRSRSSRLGAQLHAFLISSGVLSSAPRRGLLLSKLVVLYSLSGQPSRARQLFDRISHRTPFLWNALIRGHAQSGLPLDALRLFARMVSLGLSPDYFTYPFALKACADLSLHRLGAQVHGKSLASGFGADEYVQNCLIAMYMSCGDTNAATKVFDLMTARSIVSWNTVIAGCCRNGFAREALAVFDRMMDAGVGIDEATAVSVLPACAHLKDLRRGRLVQKLVDEGGFDADSSVRNSLIDMYAKCGCLEEATRVFDGGQCERDVVAWTAMIGAYALHGRESEALALSHRMVESGVAPNEVTFTSMLYSCSHAGLVDEGLHLFDKMSNAHGVKPNADHYACVVDLLGRAGRLREAYELIAGMPLEPNHAVWGALLGACVIHENVELGELAAKRLFEIEPENTGNYVLLGNIYAAVGRWADVESVRSMMVRRGLRKAPGRSLVEARKVEASRRQFRSSSSSCGAPFTVPEGDVNF
ncbi:Pentatricopeptide repeat-containing protein [Musa troglodytarum]|uniref:Pentatricopeptide repeat-containing protein n=1 Tax=Musa troglodytarum TaxID=320322 RepID=A0A9E7JXW0_9LILI|nr:Pentatricopeptide repeat-containing protein [Musa troglodytarum]